MQRPIAIISTGHTFPAIQAERGDFHDWIRAGLGNEVSTLHIDAQQQPSLPQPDDLAGVVLTGSHSMVTDQAPWSEALAHWLRHAVAQGLPTLGICYGHQLLAHALGGSVGYHPKGLEIGTHTIQRHTAAATDALFSDLPAQFTGQLVHAQSVLQLPANAQLLASNAHEPHQAFRVGSCAWGVQFHPEFSAPAMRAYIEHVSQDHADSHLPWASLAAAVQDTPQAASLLRKFAQFTQQQAAQLSC